MKPLERRLSALESAAPTEDDERTWPWVRLLWHRGEPSPVIPARHNAIVSRVITPGDPPEWMTMAGDAT